MSLSDIDRFRGDHHFLSNFYVREMVVDSKTFATNEHFFQASKARDDAWFEVIRTCPSAGDSKHLGHEVPMRPDWEEIKNDIMLKGLRIKFSLPDMREKLLATGDRVLVEGNTWHDQYWGRCDCSNHGGEGLNWLGRMLMQVRAEIREGK